MTLFPTFIGNAKQPTLRNQRCDSENEKTRRMGHFETSRHFLTNTDTLSIRNLPQRNHIRRSVAMRRSQFFVCQSIILLPHELHDSSRVAEQGNVCDGGNLPQEHVVEIDNGSNMFTVLHDCLQRVSSNRHKASRGIRVERRCWENGFGHPVPRNVNSDGLVSLNDVSY